MMNELARAAAIREAIAIMLRIETLLIEAGEQHKIDAAREIEIREAA
jgi:hypothetical protein